MPKPLLASIYPFEFNVGPIIGEAYRACVIKGVQREPERVVVGSPIKVASLVKGVPLVEVSSLSSQFKSFPINSCPK